jgi:dUTP pyrophosphatase
VIEKYWPLKVLKLHPDARIPTRAYEHAAGWDLYALRDTTLEPGEPTIVEVGLAVEIPEGCFGWIVGRSSTSKRGWAVLPGVIDSDYRGEIGPRVLKVGQVQWEQNGGQGGNWELATAEPETVFAGDRIAQLLILPHLAVDVEEVQKLSSTLRGAKGHGSTGK